MLFSETNVLRLTLVALAVSCAALTGCVNAPVRKVQVEAEGWQIREGQATWQPGRNRPELAGDLLLASAGKVSVVSFSKNPLPIVDAQRTSTNWLIEFPVQKIRIARRGAKPPSRFLWLHLPAALQGEAIPGNLQFSRNPDGSWRLVNTRSGETIEGFLSE